MTQRSWRQPRLPVLEVSIHHAEDHGDQATRAADRIPGLLGNNDQWGRVDARAVQMVDSDGVIVEHADPPVIVDIGWIDGVDTGAARAVAQMEVDRVIRSVARGA